MATPSLSRSFCDTCGKVKGISKCEGCGKIYCFIHFGEHREELNKQLEEVEISRDVFRQTLTEQIIEPQKHALIQRINEWEQNAIAKIQQTAEETRQLLLKHTTKHLTDIEAKLTILTDQLRHSHQENDFVETDLYQWKEQIDQFNKELSKPSHITLQQSSKSLISKIYVDIAEMMSYVNKIRADTRWKPNGITVAGGNGRGNRLDQLHSPWGIYIDNDDQTVYVADFRNNRVMEWKRNATSGRIVAGGNSEENGTDQLYRPTDVIFDKENDSFIVCDPHNMRVTRWSRNSETNGQPIISNVCCHGLAKHNAGYLYVPDTSKYEVRRLKSGDTVGTVVAGGNGQGNRLNQLDDPLYIYVGHDYSLYVSDQNNHRVMKWMRNAREGIIVAGGQGEGNSLSQLSNPRGVVVDQLGNIYVADSGNQRIMRWSKGDTKGSIVAGGNGTGAHASQLFNPQDISFDRQGNLYVVDLGNHRVQRFDIDSSSNSKS